MKKNLTKEEALEVAHRLDLTKYTNIDSLIDGLHIEHNKEINVCVMTTDKRSAEYLFGTLIGLNLRLGFDFTFKAKMLHGEGQYTLLTGYGELSVDADQFRTAVMQSNTECIVTSENNNLKNLKLTLIYAPEYSSIDFDTWRCMGLEADKVILVLNSNHILSQIEQAFVKDLLLPVYSPSRLLVGIGNAQYVRPEEWSDAVARVHRFMGVDYTVFPIFTEGLPEDAQAAYAGSDITIESILEQTGKNAMLLRKIHVEDLDKFKTYVLEQALSQTRQELEKHQNSSSEASEVLNLDISRLGRSRSHIESYIDLFLKTPLEAKYREDTEQFASRLTTSLIEDIRNSSDIKREAKSLPRYLTFVWEQFSDDCNSTLAKIFEKETATIVEMMKLDLKKVTRDINHINLDTNLKNHLDGAFSVHSFFARKTTAGNGLTDALTIGGVVATVFGAPIGIAAILSSELIKIFGKKQFDQEYKDELVKKIAKVVERNKNELLSQASANFKNVSDAYRAEILKYYDDMTEVIKDSMEKEKTRLSEASETLEYIDTLI